MIAYCDRRSPIHALDPRIKIAWSVVVSFLAVVLRHPASLAVLVGLSLVPWVVARPPLAKVRWLLILAATTAAGAVISQGFFYGLQPRTELLTLLPGLSLCKEGLFYGGVVSLRLISVLAAGAIVVLTTYTSDLILAMGKLRVPHSLAFMLTLALRFLPETVEQGKRIHAAQQLRGAGGRGPVAALRRFRLLLVPLMASSLRSARQVALAAEVRAYSPDRIPSRDLCLTRTDWAAAAGLVLLLVLGTAMTMWEYGVLPLAIR